MESLLLERGLVKARCGQPADVEVIHTCSVTNTAAAKSRQAIRRAIRRQAKAGMQEEGRHLPLPVGGEWTPQIVVTGCYGATNTAEAAELAGGPHRVIDHRADDGTTLADRLARRLDEWLARPALQGRVRSRPGGSFRQTVRPLPVVQPRAEAGTHIRAELKIQDGCDASCTFCIIPKIRTTLRSKTIPDAVAEARRLVELGHREIVLTGIYLGAYGHETALRRRQAAPGGEPLADLLDAIARVPGLARLRLSSLEPGDVGEPLLDAMAANQPMVVPHLHLPLQSGSDEILRRMNRQYRVGDYLEMIDRVNEALTTPEGLSPAITTDVICGFPGETPQDFERTVDVAKRVGYLHMHVFPFSPKRGTAAARWRSRFIDPATTRCRVRRLIELEDDPTVGLSIRYRRRLLGRTVRVIVEQTDRTDPGLVTGRCDHYAQSRVRADRPRGTLVWARITEVTPGRTVGTLVPPTISLPVCQ